METRKRSVLNAMRLAGWCAAAAMMAGMTGCADGKKSPAPQPTATQPAQAAPKSPTTQKLPDAAALQARAERLWDAKVRKDWATVYEFEDPEMTKTAPVEEFVKWSEEHEPFRIQSARIGEIIIDGQLAWADVTYTTVIKRFEQLPPKDAQQWQRWHVVNGQWYPVPIRELEFYPESPKFRDQAQERRLRQRFEESWQALVDKDWKTLYRLSDPEDVKDLSEEEFAKRQGLVNYLSHEIAWVEVMRDLGKVRVLYEIKLTDPNMTKLPPQKLYLTDPWIKRGDEWYRDLSRS